MIGAQELVDLQDKGDEIVESIEYVANLKYITPIKDDKKSNGIYLYYERQPDCLFG